MNTFKAGQVVKLKCGGPKLVVASTTEDSVTVNYFDGSKLETHIVAPETLTIVELFPEKLWTVEEGEVVKTFTMRGAASFGMAYAAAALEWAKEKAEGAPIKLSIDGADLKVEIGTEK